jgi:hypothetical protein
MPRALEDIKLLQGKLLVAQMRATTPSSNLQDAEFRVFSQGGDDGIIQYLIGIVRPVPESFIEFGVEDYRESNTRFLLLNDNWRGLVMDGSARNIASIRADYQFWRHGLRADRVFVTRKNINDAIAKHGLIGEIGLLSIDIDGNDYWVWEAIEIVQPVIVVVEYNSVFGPDWAVTVPYDPQFVRNRVHHSNLFFGASLAALHRLGTFKGYDLVGSNRAGSNAYFVRRDRMRKPLRTLTAREAYIQSRFRESRDQSGRLTYLEGSERLAAIASMSVWDVEGQRIVKLSDLG